MDKLLGLGKGDDYQEHNVELQRAIGTAVGTHWHCSCGLEIAYKANLARHPEFTHVNVLQWHLTNSTVRLFDTI